MVKTGLHWLTQATESPVEDVLDRMGGAHSRVESVGGYGHPRSIVHESGARIYFGSKRSDQPVVVNMPGEVCEGWWAEGIAWAEDLGGYVTRCDLALDLEPADESRHRMIEMRRAWKRGKVDTRIRRMREFKDDGEGQGWTWMFGSPCSDLQLRTYDRRGPLRLEFQWKPEREVGRSLPEMLARRGCSSVWRGLAKSIVFPMRWYQELLVGDTATWGACEREDSLFRQTVDQLQVQLGSTAWALQLLGMTLADLERDPGESIRGDLAAKLLRWADEADDEGYDGEKLREAVQCRLKSERSKK